VIYLKPRNKTIRDIVVKKFKKRGATLAADHLARIDDDVVPTFDGFFTWEEIWSNLDTDIGRHKHHQAGFDKSPHAEYWTEQEGRRIHGEDWDLGKLDSPSNK
jgi:hypothetical protein